jgi:alcohol-forming fatty acyl-CoA reductase
MGKVLLEKLLFSCYEVKEMLILCRDKRGQTPVERVEKLKKLEVSD